MLKFFRFPFATTGDKVAIPDTAQPTGTVSYTTGFGLDYEGDPATNPNAKAVPRDETNQVLYDITQAIRELQTFGVPDHITSALNGGTPFSYSTNALVRGTDGIIYKSLINGNTSTPPNVNWISDDFYATATRAGKIELATTAEAVAGVDNTRAVTPIGMATYCPNASTTQRGKIQLATTAEFNAGIDNTKAVTSSMVASKANKGVNSDITNLIGLNTSQNWPNVGSLEVGSSVPTAGGGNYIISYNASASANSLSRIWSRQRNTSNSAWIDTFLETKNDNNSALFTNNPFLNVFSGGVNGLRWQNGITEFLPIAGFGGLARLYGASTNVWDIYATAAATPTLHINNNPGSTGVRLIWGQNTWATLSDETKKTAITPIPNALGKVNQLRAGTGRYLTDDRDKSRAFVGAQSVQAVLPEAVYQDTDGLVLSETNLIPLLINAIQELTKRIEELEKA
jgi:hypothetical protein